MEATSFIHVVDNFLDDQTCKDLVNGPTIGDDIHRSLVQVVEDYLLETTGRTPPGVKVISSEILTQTDGERGGWFVRPGDISGASVGVLVMLCEVVNGGSTLFTIQDVKVTPVPGTIVIFPTNWAFNFESYHPKAGTKHFLQAYLTFDKVY